MMGRWVAEIDTGEGPREGGLNAFGGKVAERAVDGKVAVGGTTGPA